MAKGIYIGGGGVARRVKKIYVGVGGVARKVKKGYIGVGGVARPFYSVVDLAYYGKIAALGTARLDAVSANAGNYIVFLGGNMSSDIEVSPSRAVDAYSSTLVKATIDMLDAYGFRYDHTAASVGQYALFPGGSNKTYQHSRVDAYNSSLVHSRAPDLSESRSTGNGGVSIGNYAITIGGRNASSYRKSADAYDINLVKTRLPDLPEALDKTTAARAGNYALILGYRPTVNEIRVFSYTADLVRSTVELSLYRYYIKAASAGQYALFAGSGHVPSAMTDLVDVYNPSLVRSSIRLSEAKYDMSATSTGELAVFVNGKTPDRTNIFEVEAYDSSLTRRPMLSINTHSGCPGSIGKYVIVAGGRTYPGGAKDRTADVEVYLVT